MLKHKAIITDDEHGAREVLRSLLEMYCPDVEIIDECRNLLEAVESIKQNKPDVVFLDIEMPEYAGYEVINFFEHIDFHIIFVTAYDQYAVKAFEVSAIDYLLKPIEISRLQQAIKRLDDTRSKEEVHLQYKTFKETLDVGEVDKIIVKNNGNQHVLKTSEIIAIEAQESYSYIYTINNDRFMVSKNLKYYQSLLENNNSFYRSHKSWLINKQNFISFSKSRLEIVLKNEIKAKLSKYKTSDFEVFLLK
ncbi:MAG: LytR/AlgR family response regulator transcription factor [Flavobacteriales bacterium]